MTGRRGRAVTFSVKCVIARSVSDKAISLNPGIASSLSLLAMTELNSHAAPTGLKRINGLRHATHITLLRSETPLKKKMYEIELSTHRRLYPTGR